MSDDLHPVATVPSSSEGDSVIERRRFLKRAAQAAWAAPVILTAIAADPARAGGCGSTVNANCCAGSVQCTVTGTVCCASGTSGAGKCRFPNGASCTKAPDCCSGTCTGGVCV